MTTDSKDANFAHPSLSGNRDVLDTGGNPNARRLGSGFVMPDGDKSRRCRSTPGCHPTSRSMPCSRPSGIGRGAPKDYEPGINADGLCTRGDPNPKVECGDGTSSGPSRQAPHGRWPLTLENQP